jgi:hypothetical protein
VTLSGPRRADVASFLRLSERVAQEMGHAVPQG